MEQESIPEVEIVHEAFPHQFCCHPSRFPWFGCRGAAVDVRQARAGDEERTSFLAWSFQKLLKIGHGGGRVSVTQFDVRLKSSTAHPEGGNIPRHKLQERFDAFGRRQWAMLLRQAIESVENITKVTISPNELNARSHS